jgi:hypothetical protein
MRMARCASILNDRNQHFSAGFIFKVIAVICVWCFGVIVIRYYSVTLHVGHDVENIHHCGNSFKQKLYYSINKNYFCLFMYYELRCVLGGGGV